VSRHRAACSGTQAATVLAYAVPAIPAAACPAIPLATASVPPGIRLRVIG